MATVMDRQVTLSLESEPQPCLRCSRETRLRVYPEMVCASCWSMGVLREYVAQAEEVLQGAVRAHGTPPRRL